MNENEIQENTNEDVQSRSDSVSNPLSGNSDNITDVPEETSDETSEDVSEETSGETSEEVPEETSGETVETIGISQDDFYRFNNNFVSSISFVGIVLGIISGLLLGMLFNGIFRD